MADKTEISWADATHNEWMGCAKVSPACDGCYAEALVAGRFGKAVWGGPGLGAGTRTLTSVANRRKPLAWERKAAQDGTRPFVFCSSLSDVFDNEIDPEWRRGLFETIWATPHLTWLLLTKRPGMIERLWFKSAGTMRGDGAFPRNAAIGCTVVNQEEADRDIPKLLIAKAALKPAFAFVSMEPLLGPVDLTDLDCGARRDGAHGWSALQPLGDRPRIDWVITGGETDQGGHKARPLELGWIRGLRDQCEEAGVPFHHKQWGEWVPPSQVHPSRLSAPVAANIGNIPAVRLGKHQTGRLVDGVLHDARPTVAA